MTYYPAFLDLKDKRAVVIGGGRVAERKVSSLLKAGAKVTVISPSLTARLTKEKRKKTIIHKAKEFEKGDVRGAFLVIAATDSPETNRKAALNAPALVNVADVPSQCNFIAPSVVKRGPLVIAISTGGSSPALAKTIRKELEKMYGTDFSGYLRFISALRHRALAEIRDAKKRAEFLKFSGSAEMLELLRSKGFAEARKRVLKRYADMGKGGG